MIRLNAELAVTATGRFSFLVIPQQSFQLYAEWIVKYPFWIKTLLLQKKIQKQGKTVEEKVSPYFLLTFAISFYVINVIETASYLHWFQFRE